MTLTLQDFSLRRQTSGCCNKLPQFVVGDLVVETGTFGEEKCYRILPGADVTLPPVSAGQVIGISTDWAAHAAASPTPLWITDGTDPLINPFPVTGNEKIFLWPDIEGVHNNGTPSWVVVSTAQVATGIGIMGIGSTFIVGP